MYVFLVSDNRTHSLGVFGSGSDTFLHSWMKEKKKFGSVLQMDKVAIPNPYWTWVLAAYRRCWKCHGPLAYRNIDPGMDCFEKWRGVCVPYFIQEQGLIDSDRCWRRQIATRDIEMRKEWWWWWRCGWAGAQLGNRIARQCVRRQFAIILVHIQYTYIKKDY